MEKQTQTAVELTQDQVDFRDLLDIEIFYIGGGDAAVCLS